MSFSIKVPCSSANIGPGFDVIGLALSVWLEVRVTVDSSKKSSEHQSNCKITYEGLGKENVDLVADRNLITQTALYVLRCHDQHAFPSETHVHIINPIPLGRGLGSSGAAVVAGVMLGSEVGGLNLSKDRMLDFCLMIERHPDNVAAALFGGFVGSYLKDLDPEDMKRKEIPLSEVLPAPAGGVDTGLTPPIPPINIGKHIKFNWAPEIKCIAIIPDFEVSTAKARSVLPTEYPKADVISNLQRIALLTTALGQSPPNADMIYDGMQDKIHQPYRKTLIPGLTEILKSVTPTSQPGLLGICLSGAGPTILALATHNFEQIANHLIGEFKKENINCEWKLLEPAYDGAVCTREVEKPKAMTYADAGVSIDAGNDLVVAIKKAVKSTRRPGADAEIGGFGGALDLQAAGYDEAPIMIQAIDGIGTKLKVAFAMDKFDTVGIDLVAMNVNDLVVQGAEPLTFLDYYACSKLEIKEAVSFIEGVAAGCRESGCALVGGETAEMPGMYQGNEFDAGGCATGALKRGRTILPDMASMVEGDILLGLASDGVHSNGFSLVRKVVESKGLSYHDKAPWAPNTSIGASLLTPTRIYVKPLLKAVEKDLLKGMAHITGGGLYDNIPRMLPKTLAAEVDVSAWTVPPVLKWLKEAGNVESREFARTWNTGLGMVIVVSKENADEAQKVLEEAGERVSVIGKLFTRGEDEVVLKNLESWN
ncbi:phosphoribosylformylglycinamidine cyclo-ligase-like protein [Aureobasidium pullulans]|uniref:Homoserine kinase n=2 Tax=Aureobasidium pullulans TaxID=5580 RepID=A0A074Y195_AURPU|nr:phosphoribosylformylglycinamidine cyclo-ligase-like protein [Aureobasidium pullulans EXF-150]THW04421.1 phosphoribosylformylglycinamidine cyclo-ligase-like protein [Aureobasidium pullulans]KEQ89684.1 phosphoribosylformylglycinamidine cyclo-ligase-like protein [Aureobasidium pullulans EXF-150]THW28395.1 phosphoribosylformylglycinamidine cyclo-ligase-like protein [Aureobasidium pullulans]THW57920.1 phosphoribosylformylglycinamidine cyclo-ligase-like protein [Aureobasidium pullulans]THX08495.1